MAQWHSLVMEQLGRCGALQMHIKCDNSSEADMAISGTGSNTNCTRHDPAATAPAVRDGGNSINFRSHELIIAGRCIYKNPISGLV